MSMPYLHDQQPRRPLVRSKTDIARSAMMNATSISTTENERQQPTRAMTYQPVGTMKPPLADYRQTLSDTPMSTAPNSPQIPPKRKDSGDKINRVRPTTLHIPGLTSSKVSPDGRISQRDVGSKLVIVMVGLPARGKSYITKKLARWFNWLQHDTKIFNVGNRRRVAAGSPQASRRTSRANQEHSDFDAAYRNGVTYEQHTNDVPSMAARILSNDPTVVKSTSPTSNPMNIPILNLPDAGEPEHAANPQDPKSMDHNAAFFDPNNQEASRIREQCALDTLDELLDYILFGNGSVGILDATNSTLERRSLVMDHVRERAGPQLNVLFIESTCLDANLLERNIRLKLSGPDYIGKDPESSLKDFKQRIEMYEKSYVPLGEHEERKGMPYIQMIDVGRKMITHQIKGFLSSQAMYYLANFNLAPRQIWITRHGQSEDNVNGRIGGDANLTAYGRKYAHDLTTFLAEQRLRWEEHELDKKKQAQSSPLPGSLTPPNPHYPYDDDIVSKNFCVWTSMLKRSVQTAQFFDEEDFDIKQMKMLDEINAGHYEGLTYDQIKTDHMDEYKARHNDKLRYRYPGPGGESYLDIINRLRPVIVELERMTDHVLLIGHRGIARVLLAYFKGLSREEVADLDVPIGVAYCLEPKPYGVDFKAFRYNDTTGTFAEENDYKLQPARSHLD